MYLKGRFKLIRKYDCDFWNLMYYKRKKNKFFNYFKHSLAWKVKTKTYNKEIFWQAPRKKKPPFVSALGTYKKDQAYRNVFFANQNILDIFVLTKKRLWKLFRRRRAGHVSYVYRRCFFKKSLSSYDLLLGTSSAFMLYKPFRRKLIERKRHFFRKLTLFYNDFDNIKLKRFGRLGRKGQFGGVNFFFSLLESRIDSIVLRLNIASKFVLREVIKAGRVLVDDIPRSYPNYIVKKGCVVTFRRDIKAKVYDSLLYKIPRKVFFVQPPFYLEINYRTLMILVVRSLIDPSFVPYPFLKSKSRILAGLHTVLWGW